MTRAVVLIGALIAAACGSTSTAAPAGPPPPHVQVVTLAPSPVPDATELVATLRAGDRALEAYLSIPAERAGELRGAKIDLIDSLQQPIATRHARVVLPRIGAGARTVLIVADVVDAPAPLQIAPFARARVAWGARERLAIPAAAVQRSGAATFAFVAEGSPGRVVARQRPVALGDKVDTGYIVVAGVRAGDRVIVSGTQALRDGDPIAIEP